MFSRIASTAVAGCPGSGGQGRDLRVLGVRTPGGEQQDGDRPRGAGGLMALMGPRVRGDLAGDFPGLDSPDRGDLRVTTDFRSVYGSLIADWLGGDPAAVIPQNGFGTTVGRPMFT